MRAGEHESSEEEPEPEIDASQAADNPLVPPEVPGNERERKVLLLRSLYTHPYNTYNIASP